MESVWLHAEFLQLVVPPYGASIQYHSLTLEVMILGENASVILCLMENTTIFFYQIHTEVDRKIPVCLYTRLEAYSGTVGPTDFY